MADAARDAAAPDQPARDRALDPTRSFIVQAPAGSGKTTLLTQRLLVLLARVARPEAVLAITFTQKAAAEMRERVIESLARAGAGAAPEHAADAQTLALAARALAHAKASGWNLAEQPSRLRIQTIDSLNHWLAERLPILSRAGASLEIETRPGPLYTLAAQRTLAEVDAPGPLADALAVVLEHLDNEVDRLEQLLALMLEGRDRWLRVVVHAAAAARGATLRAVLEEALGHLISEALQAAAARLSPGAGERLVALARGAAARLAPDDARFEALAAASGWPLPTGAAALPLWQTLVSLLLTANGAWRKSITKSQGLPPEAKAEKAAFVALIAELATVDGLEAALAAIQPLPPDRYSEPQWAVLEALGEVLLAAAARLGEVFAEHGRVDFSAVSQAALQALGSPEEPSDLTLQLDYRIEHVLVDEFQDTSAPQVALLERLTAGWQRGDARTLFLVGDPMQSIYLFREADVGLFLRIRAAGLGGIELEPLALEANFRSRPGLVDWFNATFARVLPAAEDLARGAVRYAPARAVRAPAAGPAVEYSVLVDATPQAEAARVVALIRREQAARANVRIAVLGRSRAQLTPVATALEAAGIRYQGVDLVPLAERPAVRDLVALTRALLHLGDRIAWLACLRAPWCGLALADLHVLAGDGEGVVIRDAIADPARLERLDALAAARLGRVRDVLEAALAERGRRPLAAWVEAAWNALGGPATLLEAADLVNARSFFARLDLLERAGDLEDPAALEAELADLYAAPDPAATDALQLLTVHKAKGLEWDVVILTGLGRGSRAAERRLLAWLEVTRRDGGPGLVLVPHRARAHGSDPLEDWLRRLAADRGRLELGRLLYVATTRAEERLHLVCHVGQDADGAVRAPGRGTLLATLWPAAEADVRAAAGLATTPATGGLAAAPAVLRRLAADWQAPPAPAAVVESGDPLLPEGPSEFEFEWVTAAARHVGTVVHEELERAALRGLAPAEAFVGRADAWRRRLVELGVGPDQLEGASARVARALAATAADPRGAWLFDPGHAGAASELALSTARGGRIVTARIDRTFIDRDGVRWIVDYKTSEHEGTDLEAFLDQERQRYTPQLERYALLLRAREPGRPVRLGLYFPLHAAWREWAPGERLALALAPDAG